MALFVHGPRPESPYPNYMSLCVSVIFYVDIAMRLKMAMDMDGTRKWMAQRGPWVALGTDNNPLKRWN